MAWIYRCISLVLVTVSSLAQDCCQYNEENQVFSCYDCSPLLEVIPRDIPREVEEIQINNQAINTLLAEDLAGMAALRRVYLKGNKLTHIETNTLEGTPVLSILDLADNQLTDLPPNLPESLTMLYLSGNPIRDLSSESFPELPQLYRLELAADQLGANILVRMPNLRELWIEVCHIGAYAFADLVELDWLTVRAPCHYPEEYGTTLSMEPHAFSDIPVVFDIWIHYSDGVGNIPENAFTGMSVLDTVSISACGLQDIASGAFRDLPGLTWFHIMPCDGEEESGVHHDPTMVLKADTFQNTTNVKQVHLKGLSLAEIEPHTFSAMRELLVLRMDGVDLRTLHADVLIPISLSLQLISLGLNPWHCDCQLRWLKEWTDASFVVEDRYQIECDSPEELQGRTFQSLSPEDFVCLPGSKLN